MKDKKISTSILHYYIIFLPVGFASIFSVFSICIDIYVYISTGVFTIDSIGLIKGAKNGFIAGLIGALGAYILAKIKDQEVEGRQQELLKKQEVIAKQLTKSEKLDRAIRGSNRQDEK